MDGALIETDVNKYEINKITGTTTFYYCTSP